MIDPGHLKSNSVIPPVRVEQIVADDKAYQNAAGIRLPALTKDLEISYTALSLMIPEKVLFRYKLEGMDSDWRDAGTRRAAFYSNLRPGNYRFRVIACNNDGLWDETGASVDFTVLPAWYQTLWFRSAFIVAFALLLGALYKLRLRQLARQYSMRFEERVSERMRIARELHDTLLQSFQAHLLHLHVISNLLPGHPEEGKQKLDIAIEGAAEAIREGREVVQDLRSSTAGSEDLAVALTALGQELATAEANLNAPVLHVKVQGTPRQLQPLLRDEVYRIAGEALRNAFRHAGAKRIDAEIHYDKNQLRVRIRDDGKGMEPQVVVDAGRPGHWGLHGMRERAKLMGGNLELWSNLHSGTEIELSIPASAAYATTQQRSWLPKK